MGDGPLMLLFIPDCPSRAAMTRVHASLSVKVILIFHSRRTRPVLPCLTRASLFYPVQTKLPCMYPLLVRCLRDSVPQQAHLPYVDVKRMGPCVWNTNFTHPLATGLVSAMVVVIVVIAAAALLCRRLSGTAGDRCSQRSALRSCGSSNYFISLTLLGTGPFPYRA